MPLKLIFRELEYSLENVSSSLAQHSTAHAVLGRAAQSRTPRTAQHSTAPGETTACAWAGQRKREVCACHMMSGYVASSHVMSCDVTCDDVMSCTRVRFDYVWDVPNSWISPYQVTRGMWHVTCGM